MKLIYLNKAIKYMFINKNDRKQKKIALDWVNECALFQTPFKI